MPWCYQAMWPGEHRTWERKTSFVLHKVTAGSAANLSFSICGCKIHATRARFWLMKFMTAAWLRFKGRSSSSTCNVHIKKVRKEGRETEESVCGIFLIGVTENLKFSIQSATSQYIPSRLHSLEERWYEECNRIDQNTYFDNGIQSYQQLRSFLSQFCYQLYDTLDLHTYKHTAAHKHAYQLKKRERDIPQ